MMQPPPTAADAWYEIRGGSFKDPLDPKIIWDVAYVPGLWKYANIGFRCAKDPQ
jgi:hypothetical protein